MSEFKTIQISKIKPNTQQPRKHFTGIEDLAESIGVRVKALAKQERRSVGSVIRRAVEMYLKEKK